MSQTGGLIRILEVTWLDLRGNALRRLSSVVHRVQPAGPIRDFLNSSRFKVGRRGHFRSRSFVVSLTVFRGHMFKNFGLETSFASRQQRIWLAIGCPAIDFHCANQVDIKSSGSVQRWSSIDIGGQMTLLARSFRRAGLFNVEGAPPNHRNVSWLQ